jgi:superfamily II DNA or RNA helicase
MVGRVLRPAPGKTDALILDHAGAVFSHGLPDDEITWTLAEDRKAENRAHASRGTRHATGLTTCPECAAVRLEGRPCPFCGWRPRVRSAAVDALDGDLEQVDRAGAIRAQIVEREEKRQFHAQLVWIARERGYQSGWAAHKFKEKFGEWPPDRSIVPAAPDEGTRSWIRSRQIAYAKAMAKQRGAA